MRFYHLLALVALGGSSALGKTNKMKRNRRMSTSSRFARILDEDCEGDPDLCRHNDDPSGRTTAPVASPGVTNEPTPVPAPTESPGSAEEQGGGAAGNPPCVADSEGLYGESSQTKVLLEYFYQIQFDRGVLSAIDSDTLALIEGSVSDALAVRFFHEACSESRSETPTNLRSRKLNTVGYQDTKDSVLSQGPCSNDAGNGNEYCALVRGQGLLFVDQERNAETAGSNAIESLRTVLQSDTLFVRDGVEGLVFLNGTHTTVEDAGRGSVGNAQNGDDDDDGLPGYAIALITLACIALVVAATLFVVARRRRRNATRPPVGLMQLESIASIDSASEDQEEEVTLDRDGDLQVD